MKSSTHARANIVVLLAVLVSSAGTMLWLFWRFPVLTSIATALVLLSLGISARMATSSDTDSLAELDRRPGAHTH